MKPTNYPCYAQVVYDLVNGIIPEQGKYPEFEKKGENAFNAWFAYAKMALHLVRTCKPDLEAQQEFAKAVIDYVRQPCNKTYECLFEPASKLGIYNPLGAICDFDHAAGEYVIPNYVLTEEECNIILRAEQHGRGLPENFFDHPGRFGNHNVKLIDYRKIPAHQSNLPDVVVVMGGHQQSAFRAMELFYHYVHNHHAIPDYIFNNGYKPEMEFYIGRCQADIYAKEEETLGLPLDMENELLLDSADSKTWDEIDNVVLLSERFGLQPCNLIIVSYPSAQLRITHELVKKLEAVDSSAYVNITIADIPPHTKGEASLWNADFSDYDEYRVLSSDKVSMLLGDVCIDNCLAIADSVAFPEELKRLAPMFLAKSNAKTLSLLNGTLGKAAAVDEEVAKVMSILRYLQLCEYNKEQYSEAKNELVKFYTYRTIKRLQKLKLCGKAILEDLRYMDRQEALECILAFQDLLQAEK